MITGAGKIEEEVSLQIEGYLPVNAAPAKAVKPRLDIQWSEGFRYRNSGMQEYGGYTDVERDAGYPVLIWFGHYDYDLILNEPSFIEGVICYEQQFVIFQFGHNEDLYMVVSTDPDADYLALIQYFVEFGNKNKAPGLHE